MDRIKNITNNVRFVGRVSTSVETIILYIFAALLTGYGMYKAAKPRAPGSYEEKEKIDITFVFVLAACIAVTAFAQQYLATHVPFIALLFGLSFMVQLLETATNPDL